MFKKISFILLAILLCQGILKSQTSQLTDTTVYTLGFSTYLSQIDKYASGVDIYSDSEGYTYISGNARDKNFPTTEGAYQTQLKGDGLVLLLLMLSLRVQRIHLPPKFLSLPKKTDGSL